MARLTKDECIAICAVSGINPAVDYHAMPQAMKEAVLRAADSRNYKKPVNANGSRGRMFFEYLSRVYNRPSKPKPEKFFVGQRIAFLHYGSMMHGFIARFSDCRNIVYLTDGRWLLSESIHAYN